MVTYKGREIPEAETPGENRIRVYNSKDLPDEARPGYLRCDGCGKTYMDPEDIRGGFRKPAPKGLEIVQETNDKGVSRFATTEVTLYSYKCPNCSKGKIEDIDTR